MRHAEDFFAFARERERVRIKKEGGEEPPWTDDPVLQTCFFCNVFREDDRLTRWFRQNIRDAVAEHASRAILACTAFRWFNYQPSGEVLKPYLLGQRPWRHREILLKLNRLPQVIGGAYMIKSPPNLKKAAGLIKCLSPVVRDVGVLARSEWTMQDLHARMMQYPYLGRFMAYEIVSDLRHTKVLRRAPDINEWASAGPGCARGLGWVLEDNPDAFGYTTKAHEAAMVDMMQELLAMSATYRWPWPDRPWEMREVEHVLCEFGKYRAAQTGRRVKRRYDAGVARS